MPTDLPARVKVFCYMLAEDTGRQPMQWRSIAVIGAKCRMRAPAELQKIVAYAEKSGWLIVEDAHSVALTEAGRKLF